MKKIFTLLFATALLGTAFAQYGQRDQRDQRNDSKANDVYVSNNDPGYGQHNKGRYGGYMFTPRERDMEINRINRDYDWKIQSVRNKQFMGWYQKKRVINNLEVQRDAEIQQVIYKFQSPKNQFGDRGRKDKKRW